MEWYDPEAVTTQNGSLVITLSQKETHGLNYEGGMYLIALSINRTDHFGFVGLISTWLVESTPSSSNKKLIHLRLIFQGTNSASQEVISRHLLSSQGRTISSDCGQLSGPWAIWDVRDTERL